MKAETVLSMFVVFLLVLGAVVLGVVGYSSAAPGPALLGVGGSTAGMPLRPGPVGH
ncbi:hypothetical protein BJQ94_14540 [Cryobacterium sp. SO2]|uniref:hypothetical protein n=1 Tax=Cryobacterium sp. SO2 TaxID=1897060 RepID=UPI00223D0940|nr:hypothetical protein [Cryobacterium sp. SO2]WEO76570.1 hypothetical protein BJQ94_14540 [Cryobacterium sp. SO2]